VGCQNAHEAGKKVETVHPYTDRTDEWDTKRLMNAAVLSSRTQQKPNTRVTSPRRCKWSRPDASLKDLVCCLTDTGHRNWTWARTICVGVSKPRYYKTALWAGAFFLKWRYNTQPCACWKISRPRFSIFLGGKIGSQGLECL
jgi:hypothetical protein